MEQPKKWNRVSALIGCMVANIVSGSINAWGVIGIYLASYYYSKDSSIDESDMYLAFTLSYILEPLCFIVASYLCEIIGCKFTAYIGTILGCIILFASSFTTNPYLFSILYGLAEAIISGMIDMPVIWACWPYFPNKTGLVTSIGFSGYSLGPTIFGLIWTMMVNPNNKSPHSKHNGNSSSSYFGHEVYNKVPATIRWICLIYLIMQLAGTSMITSHDKTKKGSDGIKLEKRSLKLKDILKQSLFWKLSLNFYFFVAPYAFLFTNYKSIGLTKHKNDHLFSYLGSIGFVTSCISRIFWGILVDKYGWKRVTIVSGAIQFFVYCSIYFTLTEEYLFCACVIFAFSFGSGTYLILTIGTSLLYPKDPWVVSYAVIGVALNVVTIYFVQLFITPIIGYKTLFFIISGCMIINLLITYFTPSIYNEISSQTDISLLSIEDNSVSKVKS
ncbi:unnamed protein product [Blepharisma stoltei]|uniref:Uncharacterized protein n=1 Tax=Blepharisma stoltei TaxID=1481888 RepID=A0AAU9JT73_9CILI|nr:unnamed protein product [Blepharisma stoltei]